MEMIGSQKGSIKVHEFCTVYSRFSHFCGTWGLSAFEGISQGLTYMFIYYPVRSSCLYILYKIVSSASMYQHPWSIVACQSKRHV